MNTLLLFAQPWAQRLGWTLLHFVWQGTAIALLYALIRGLTGRTLPARARYALACVALAAMALAPAATYLWTGSPAAAAPATQLVLTPLGPRSVQPASIPAASGWQQALPWIVMAWFAGVAAFSIRLAAGWIAAARLRTSRNHLAPPGCQQMLDRLIARMRIARPVRLLVSTLVESPSVIGWLRPVILAPAGILTGLSPEHIEALLAHELAHIRRHDYLVNVLQGVVESVLFYHPGVWWLSHQIRTEREHCCDDLAVAVSGDVLTYARALAELESTRPAHAQAVLAASGGSLVRRIRRLIDPARPVQSSFAWALNVMLLLAIGAIAVRGAQETPRPQDASVERDNIWTDTARQGDLKIEVRGLGTITSSTTAEIHVAESQVKHLQAGQPVAIAFRGRKEIIRGNVVRVDAPVVNATKTVEVLIGEPLPAGIAPQEPMDSTITVGTLVNVVHVGRPVFAQANSDGTLFRFDPDGRHAVRVKVHYGQMSVNQVEVKSGLQPGDQVILSDMSAFQNYDRVALR